MRELTVCSVSFQSAFFLKWNWELCRKLNPGAGYSWIVADNTPASVREAWDVDDPDFTVVPGVDGSRFTGACAPGLHHGEALNRSLRLVKTRFALIIDPDFYIVRPEWVKGIPAYMKKNNLSLFGAPWNPRWYMKPRYFPACSHCLFIDLEKIPVGSFDFKPSGRFSEQKIIETKKKIPAAVKIALRPLAQWAQWSVLSRKIIGKEEDTGYDLLRRFAADPSCRHQCLTPVFRPVRDFIGPAFAVARPARALEKILPDRLCYIPKREGYFSSSGFKELGYPDVSTREWEEFLWQAEPFGFHVRCYPKRDCDMKPDKEFLKEFLGRLTNSKQENIGVS